MQNVIASILVASWLIACLCRWNSANCLTVIADLALVNPLVASKAAAIYPNTFVQAQKYNLQQQKTVVAPTFLMQTHTGDNIPTLQCTGFLNDYYDDEGWWALAWVCYRCSSESIRSCRYGHKADSVFIVRLLCMM